jgi:signal transduction histidine kinase/ligand-binding sensor domain-containing protein/CheY-like chemotaxis protein
VRCKRRAIALPLFYWAAVAIYANTADAGLDPSKSLTQFHREVWGTEQGLPQNTVPAIAQSGDGYLWIGTELGLARFDGLHFTVFDKSNTPELRSNKIDALLTDRNGDLWIGTIGGGLSRLSHGKFETFTTEDGLSSNSVLSLFLDRSGGLWVGTNGGGVSRLSNGHFEVYKSKDGLADNEVFSLTQDRDGAVWLATNGGLSRFAKGQFHNYGVQDGLASASLRCLEMSPDGTLWIGTNGGGLSRFRNGKFTTFDLKNGLSSNAVVAIHEDSRGSLWVGTIGGGLSRMVGNQFSSYTSRNGLPADAVWSMFEDRSRNLWIGTGGGGLVRFFDGGLLTTYDTKDGLSNEAVLPIYEDKEGSLWIGTNGGGLDRFQNGRFTSLTTKDGLADNLVFTLCEDRDRTLWIGTRKGLSRLKSGRLSTYSRKDGLPSDAVFASYADREGSVWFGTRAGLVRWKDGKFKTYTTRDGLSSNVVQTIYEDHNRNLWVGTGGGGLNLYKDGKFEVFDSRRGLSNDVVMSIYEGAGGILWIGTDGGGLNRLKDGQFTAYTAKDGMLDDAVFQILPDDSGNLWMSSNKGILRASIRDLNKFAERSISHVQVTSYGTADGMNTSECNGGFQPAGWKAHDGRLWFATMKGAVAIDPRKVSNGPLPFPAVIEQVIINGRQTDMTMQIQIPPGRGELEFHYSAPDFRSARRIFFRYKLQGFDRNWLEAGGRRTVYYTNIPPGNYTFWVMADNTDEKHASSPASIRFRLKPHFYETFLFYGLCAFSVTGLGAALHQGRIRGLRGREILLELRVNERTVELRNEVTERERAELELVKAKESAEAASRVKSEFLANMSHEIRTPMTAVLGMTELALMTDCTPEQREYLAIARDSANALLSLIDDILDLSKVEAKKLELDPIDFDLRVGLEETVKLLSYRAGQKGLQIVCEVKPDVPVIVNADPLRLRQVLLNLLGNAIKFTEKGQVELRVTCDVQDAPQCSLHFTVRDSGIGIARENLNKIFEVFAQADGSTTRRFGGTGLGLAICQRFVQLMGGKIWVISELGVGSEFHFTMTCTASARNYPAWRRQAETIPQGAERKCVSIATLRLRILVVEDDPANRMLARHTLEGAGFQVHEVENGQAALEELGRHNFDLILMDCRMPVMDGYLAARHIRQLPGAISQIPIVALTASAFKEDRDQAEKAGMDDFISKPFQGEELVAKCREWGELATRGEKISRV